MIKMIKKRSMKPRVGSSKRERKLTKPLVRINKKNERGSKHIKSKIEMESHN